ncbi:hypothetical protein [Nocardia goodfellowii]|uniref:Uncharacterized protein n=1 Tax=Nocardia goodfellowii TaxID=882446 RepID=A0ABS4QC51_9NOCA|nr:hypothetical protein [Nocardia goodfellowii]MBP2189284.1 hypothetical protein [Nocardia goodfellowii]
MNLIVIIGVAVVIVVGLLAVLLRSPGTDENQLTVADIRARLEKEAEAPADH